ncbi:replicative DNA helicase [bacterium]|nr:replicative DNA helicase [bacterium]
MADKGKMENIPPQALEAERDVLGAMIMYPNLTERGLELLEAEMFYSRANAIIFNRIMELVNENSPVDEITVINTLKKYGELDKIGGADYIANLLSSVINPAHFEEHCSLIEEQALLRKIIDLSVSVIERAHRGPGDVKIFVDGVEAEFYKISEKRLRGDFVPFRSVAQDVHEDILKLQKRNRFITGISTGYNKLDRLLTGLHPSDYIVLAGRTSTGKTAFALSLARNIALNPDENERSGVAIFSLEMSKEQVALRILSSVTGVSAQRMRQGFLEKKELSQIAFKLEQIQNAPIYIDDTPNLTVMEMRAKARRLLRRVPVGVIIVDYLQLVLPSKRTDNRQEEVASISRSLKALARELDVTVIALAQLSRKVEESGDKRPRLSHLRESGAIEQDADVVLLLYRPEVHRIDKIKIPGKDEPVPSEGLASLMIAKQRNGPTGEVIFSFNKESISFEEYGYVEEENVPVAADVEGVDDYESYGGV